MAIVIGVCLCVQGSERRAEAMMRARTLLLLRSAITEGGGLEGESEAIVLSAS